jgi:hypothetical protein
MSTIPVPTPEADRIRELEAQVEALERFKKFVHAYLDGVYVPHHPPGPHGRDGCRVGDRLHWLMTRLYAAEGERDRLRAALERIASDEPYLRQDHAAVEVTDEALNAANRAQIQQHIARAALGEG